MTEATYLCPVLRHAQHNTSVKKDDHKSTELAQLFYREMAKVNGTEAWPPLAKAAALNTLLEALFLEATKAENIQFTTLFARIAFACHKFQVDKKAQYWAHLFRKMHRHAKPEEAEDVYQLGLSALAACIEGIFGQKPPADSKAFLPKKIRYGYSEAKVSGFRPQVRAVVLADDEANDRFLARDEENPSQPVHIQYNIADRNEPFGPTVRVIRSTFGFPVMVSLLDVEVVAPEAPDQLPTYRPRAFVVEPDYLLDVSAIANCFQGSSAEPVVYILQKFLPTQQTVAMTVGNIANFFLDELMNNPAATFAETFPKVFKINPLTFSLLPDSTIKEIHQTTQKHWVTLQTMVSQGMKKFGIEPSDCILEPSFYSEKYGLQGRLDIFFKKENQSAIIELKSGQPFMPNRYGIGASHFIQTLLYDLMVRSVFGETVEPASYILYSGLETNQLRYAPPVKSEQNEALQLRNQLVALDRHLATVQAKLDRVPLLERITQGRFPQIKGYLSQNIGQFEKTYAALGDLEKRYFNAFTGFVAREHQLAKTGIQGVDNANGLAALWLDSPAEKEANFQIIKSLKIKENRANEHDAIIVFSKTPGVSALANFRVGDIAVLYPASGENATTSNQIFKVTLLAISPDEVVVRLRYKQFNLQIFNEFETWNLEHDQMDMGFTAMYQGLFRFAQSSQRHQQMLLTQQPPRLPVAKLATNAPGLTDEQQGILGKMLATQDYFLLWGPPGTGKTSQMLKNYAAWILENTDENLLLLAYTNRAVDEICEALEDIGDGAKSSYLRIGSRYSCGEQFENQLLAKKIEGVATRKELKAVLDSRRVFVSTLASLSNNLELLALKQFRRVAIDEASQILEPALVGLLPRFEQFVLIGDHKQLPAVVVQDARASAVEDEKLREIGLHNLRNSLFERLYRRCVAQNWHWAFDHLSHQGRMHEDIMQFPGEHFYEGKLRVLPPSVPFAERQKMPLAVQTLDFQADWQRKVLESRIVFLRTPVDRESPSRKTNRHEAKLAAELVAFFQAFYAESGGKKSIGVITPYRAQIAQIQDVMQRMSLDPSTLTIDTVERYQGGARDVILISLCTNTASQLDSLVSLSDEGVDRKLNVALTRAREHVVVLGNEELLSQNGTYRVFLEWMAGR